MEVLTNFVLPMLVIVVVAGLYIWWLIGRRKQDETATPQPTVVKKRLQSAPVVPFMESVLLNFYHALKQALPAKYIICVNVPIEKLFEASYREDLQMKGQYADFVIFSEKLLPILVVDLFDLSVIDLNRVNKIKTVSKEILRSSGIPVLDYQYTENCNIDELRRKIADLLNPLRKN